MHFNAFRNITFHVISYIILLEFCLILLTVSSLPAHFSVSLSLFFRLSFSLNIQRLQHTQISDDFVFILIKRQHPFGYTFTSHVLLSPTYGRQHRSFVSSPLIQFNDFHNHDFPNLPNFNFSFLSCRIKYIVNFGLQRFFKPSFVYIISSTRFSIINFINF